MKKRKRRRKGLAVLLMVAMVVGMMPGVGTMKVSAAGITSSKPSGEGTSAKPYQINTADELYWFAGLVNGTLDDTEQNKDACAVLTTNITVNSNVLNGSGEPVGSSFTSWTPIGNWVNQYTGTFDGKGHTISGLYFNDTNTEEVGLFGCNKGTIKNVGIVDSYFKGKLNVGGVCGYNNYGNITDCYNASTVSGSNIGGVCGANDEGSITNCHNTGKVSGLENSDDIGGVCGINKLKGTISNCYNTGTVSGSGSNSYKIGGVSGECIQSKIINCYNTGAVTGVNSIGGVSGSCDESKITNCYNAGEIKGSGDNIGGVCGYHYGTGGEIQNCYNSGSVSSSTSTSKIGGVCGWNKMKITNCYFDSTRYTGTAVGTNEGGTVSENVRGKSTAEFKTGEVAYLLQGEQTTAVWGQNLGENGDTYPVLDGEKVFITTGCVSYNNDGNTGKKEHNYNNADICQDCDAHKGVITNKDYPILFAYCNQAITTPTKGNFNINSGATPSFQWYKGDQTNAAELPTEEKTVIGDTAPAAEGTYTLLVTTPATDATGTTPKYTEAELRLLVKIAKENLTGSVGIEGTAEYDATLTAKPTVTNTKPGTLYYQWYRVVDSTKTAIEGATGETYQLGANDIGKKIAVEITSKYCNGMLKQATENAVAKCSGTVKITSAAESLSKDYDGKPVSTPTFETLNAVGAKFETK